MPRDGALLGWVSDRQATVLLSVYHGQPSSQVRVPQVRVLAMVGSEPMRWPPFTASPLDDGRLWEYVERGEIVDLAPVIVRDGRRERSGCRRRTPAAPGTDTAASWSAATCRSEDYWVPAGIYMDHWMLREGVPTPPASHLLTLPGTVGLSRRLTRPVAVILPHGAIRAWIAEGDQPPGTVASARPDPTIRVTSHT